MTLSMTNEQAREYWCRKLERAEGYSDEHWDAEERNAHKDYIDALLHAVTALAICREHEETWKPKTNGDRIRSMTDEELADWLTDGHDICDLCQFGTCRPEFECEKGVLEWLKQEVSENAAD